MSGPKIDSISIEQMRAMQLAAERSRNDFMLHEALIKLDKHISSLKADCLQLRNHRNDVMSEIERLEQSLRESMVQVATQGYPAGIEEARTFNDRVSEELGAIIASVENKTAPTKERIRSAVSNQQETLKVKALADQLEKADDATYGYLADDIILQLLEQASSVSPTNESSINAESKRHALEDARLITARLRQAIASDSTDAARKTILANLAKRMSEMLISVDSGTKDAAAIRDLIDEVNPVINEIEAHCKVMKDLYVDCIIQKGALFNLGHHAISLPPLWKFREEDELEKELNELKTLSCKVSEDSYIEHALNAVMFKHGYSIAKKVVISDDQQGGHRMFIREKGDVGIHAYLASNGVLAMEVASVADEVRIADDNSMVRKSIANSSYDRMRLVKEQKGFCELHPSLISELSEYGISVANLKDKDPSEDYSVMFEAAGVKQRDSDNAVQERKKTRDQSILREKAMK